MTNNNILADKNSINIQKIMPETSGEGVQKGLNVWVLDYDEEGDDLLKI